MISEFISSRIVDFNLASLLKNVTHSFTSILQRQSLGCFLRNDVESLDKKSMQRNIYTCICD